MSFQAKPLTQWIEAKKTFCLVLRPQWTKIVWLWFENDKLPPAKTVWIFQYIMKPFTWGFEGEAAWNFSTWPHCTSNVSLHLENCTRKSLNQRQHSCIYIIWTYITCVNDPNAVDTFYRNLLLLWAILQFQVSPFLQPPLQCLPRSSTAVVAQCAWQRGAMANHETFWKSKPW